jgi:hypothetical protein
MKMTVSQSSTTSNGMETEVVACSYISQRVLPISIAILNAWPWSERCVSFFAGSPLKQSAQYCNIPSFPLSRKLTPMTPLDQSPIYCLAAF